MALFKVQSFYMKAITMIAVTAMLMASVMGEDDDGDAADFVGAVLKRNGFSCGRGCVISENGGMAYSSSSGRSIISTEGFYFKSGRSVVGKDETFISKSGNFFYGTSATIKAGSAYMNGDAVWVSSAKEDDD
jgi:hypothetical protein